MKLAHPLIEFIQRSDLRARAAGRTVRGSGRVAVVHWDRERVYFLVVTPKSTKLAPADYGSVPYADVANPFMALAEHFRQHSVQVQRLVVLLSRPELELLTLTLPPASTTEVPSLVASEVEQQLGEAEQPPAIDFYLLPNTRIVPTDSDSSATPSGVQVLAFALPANVQQSLQSQITSAGFRVVAIGSRHLAPLGLLRRKPVPENTPTVSVHLYASEAELAICRGAEPVLLRSIRVNPEDPSQVAEQILLESQRCLALLPHDFAEQTFSWFVYSSCEASWQVAKALEAHEQISIQPVDPLMGWEVDADVEPTLAQGFASAANSGAAWDYLFSRLPVDLLAPKKAPKEANPMIRWAALGAAAALVLALGVTFMLSDVNQLRDEVETLQNELNGAQQVTSKYKEKADQVAAVESWLSDQVDWVDELNSLSKRLPDGQNATVRRLTATVNGNSAVIDLAVQVAQQETISQLEAGIRSAKYNVTSKQISQNPETTEYPWQFETRVVFPVEANKSGGQFKILTERNVEGNNAPATAPASSMESTQ